MANVPPGWREAADDSVAALRAAPEIMVQRLSAGRHGLMSVQETSALGRIVGVQAVVPRLWAYHRDPASGETLLLRVPDDGRLTGREAAAGADLLRRRHLGVGAVLYLTDHAGNPLDLVVSSVAETETPLESAAVIQLSAPAFRVLTGMREGEATDVVLRVRNRRELTTIAEKISHTTPDVRPIIRDELLRTYASVFNWRSGAIIAALLVPVLAFILFAWDKAAGLSLEERREIGILKAIGWETGDVILLKCYEALAVSLAAFLLGAGLAVGALVVPHRLAMLPALLGWSTLYPAFQPTAALGLYQFATLFFLAVFPYLAATVIPAWQAATTDPDLVMRA